MTFGVTPDLYEQIHAVGLEAFIEAQLHPEAIDDSAVDTVIQQEFPLVALSAAELIEKYRDNRGQVVQELPGATLVRALYSKRGLHEMMVHFWTDHFNIFLQKGLLLFLKVVDDRDVIRPHAMGNFLDLLYASAKSPAMLFYRIWASIWQKFR